MLVFSKYWEQKKNSWLGNLVMQVGPLLEELEVGGALEVALHHVEEAIVVVGGAARVLHKQSPSLPQRSAHRPAQLADHPLIVRRQVLGQIHHWKIHILICIWIKNKKKSERKYKLNI